MRQASGGFTLVEALIALLVLSLGLLGVAAMQLKAMQSAHVSYQRTIATIAAQDAIERLWSGLAFDSVSSSFTCPSETGMEADWKSTWSAHFNDLSASGITAEGDCRFTINLVWDDSRFAINDGEEDVSTLHYASRLPGN
ncbi:type IV pilus modification protein PilV [Litchfieldella xinjiangensis]|uniref:type IV pilus modification protein PilV n=1 Tax=Litchfieldella xinjiangensis TaxID=1166948 RepID=UPI0005BD54D9|nr:type IV pilus modification protein PilV [Halomonas xinjiangensis]